MTPEQRDRYSRHTLLPEVGVDGQLKLLNAKVLLLGAGGLGAPTALYLAAAGIGTIGLVDDDVVDASNLQRQVIHNTERIGMAKTASARIFIEGLNPDVNVIEYNGRLDASNILEIMADYDIVVDGADNFPTRYLLNDASVRLRKPVVSASILGFDGQISTFQPYEGPCYRCLYPDAAARRARPELLRQRRARRDGRDDGDAAGQRGDQARARQGRAVDRPLASLRGARAPPSPSSRSAAIPTARSAASTRPRSPSRRWVSSPTTISFVPAPAGTAERSPTRLGSPLMATVRIPPVLRPKTGGSPEVDAAGDNVGEVLRALTTAHPETSGQLFDAEGELNRYVNVYLNDEDVRVLDGLDTAVKDGDTVVILPAMAGG